MATARQIKLIHMLKNQLGWSEEEYRKYIRFHTNGFCESSKEIADAMLEKIINEMKKMLNLKEMKDRYNDLAGREGMATPKQLRMIDAMWKEVSYYKDEKARKRALRHFLKRIVGVDSLEFLEARQVRKIIKAMQKMKEAKKKKSILEGQV